MSGITSVRRHTSLGVLMVLSPLRRMLSRFRYRNGGIMGKSRLALVTILMIGAILPALMHLTKTVDYLT